MPDALDEQRDPRPYATALGFYYGDEVEVSPEGYVGRICRTFGSDSHSVEVRLDNGHRVPLEDFDLTRIR